MTIKLSEIFGHLTAGELSQLGIGGATTGGIAEADYPKVLSHVNLALADLYSRFTIKQGRLILALQPGKLVYSLTSNFAVTGRRSTEPVRYILDTAEEPFQDDINKVERVLTDCEHSLVLNQEGNRESIITTSTTLLRLPKLMITPDEIPDYMKTKNLEVIYRAAPPLITVSLGLFNPERVMVQLPRVYLQALLLYVASRAHNPAGMMTEFQSGNFYAMKYEQECARLKTANLEIDQGGANYRLERNGWV